MIHREDTKRDNLALTTLRIEHGKANAIDIDLFDALVESLDAVEPSDADAVILTGTGSSFSAGVELWKVADGGAEYLEDFLPALSRGLRRLFTFSKPVVAAINGHAIAGGCILALACDRRVATDDEEVKIGVSELKVGVPFPVAAMEVMRYALPSHVCQDLILTGRLVSPREAASLGLVDELTPLDQLEGTALAAAARLGAVPHDAFTLTKRQLRHDAIRAMEREEDLDEEIHRVWEDEDTLERIRRFMESTVGK